MNLEVRFATGAQALNSVDFQRKTYWSSTALDATSNWLLFADTGDTDFQMMYPFNVRPVRQVPLP